MGKLLKCQDMGFECDYICTSTEEELLNRAAQYAKSIETFGESPSEFRKRVRSFAMDVDHC